MEDYLWDKTGEPDPEIERLEELLGELRFHSSTLKMPVPAPSLRIATLKSSRQTFTPYLAIAATLAFLTLAGGLWLSLHSRNRIGEQPSTLAQKNAPALIKEDLKSDHKATDNKTAENNLREEQTLQSRQEGKSNLPHSVVALASQRGARQRLNNRQLESNSLNAKASKTLREEREREERARGEEAKDQLIMALRLASAKLNLAQKKVQGKPETISSHS
jgi:hypothetical protein